MQVAASIFTSDIETLGCYVFASYGRFFVRFMKISETIVVVHSKLFGTSLFVTIVLAFSVSMSTQGI